MEAKTKLKIGVTSLALALFFIGGMIYLMFRSETLLMFRWCEALHVKEYVDAIRVPCSLPHWVVFSLPDGLWLFSYMLVMASIWDYDLVRSRWYLLVLPFIAIASEVFQGVGWLRGTFDWADLACYLSALCMGYGIIGYLNKLVGLWK